MTLALQLDFVLGVGAVGIAALMRKFLSLQCKVDLSGSYPNPLLTKTLSEWSPICTLLAGNVNRTETDRQMHFKIGFMSFFRNAFARQALLLVSCLFSMLIEAYDYTNALRGLKMENFMLHYC